MMIETIVRDYLTSALKVPVYLEYPDGEAVPKKHVMIEKTGSERKDQINTSTFALQSYGERLVDAILLNEQVKEAMDAIISLGSISSAKLNSDYNFTDTDKREYRYQAVYDLVHY